MSDPHVCLLSFYSQRERITVIWTEEIFPPLSPPPSNLGGWATTAAARKTITAKTSPVAHTGAHKKLTFSRLKAADGEVHLHNAASRVAVNHGHSLRAAAKNASSEGLACLRGRASLCCSAVAWSGFEVKRQKKSGNIMLLRCLFVCLKGKELTLPSWTGRKNLPHK